MSLDVAPIGPTNFSAAPDRSPRHPRTSAVDAAEISTGDIPLSPPPEVLDAVDAAGRAYRELHANGRELRFAVDGDGADGRVHVEVHDLDGNVLRQIPLSEALDVATGAPLD